MLHIILDMNIVMKGECYTIINKNMSWLAVDKNGTECVFKRKPKRVKTTNKWNDIVIKFVCEGRLCTSTCGYEYHPTYGELQTIKQSTRSKLPKGSIEKLIGKKLTWEDEPFELK